MGWRRREKKAKSLEEKRKATSEASVDLRVQRGDAGDILDLVNPRDYNSMWSSPESFSNHIARLDEKKAWHNGGWERDRRGGWHGTEDMPSALKLAQNGWKEGAEQLDDMCSRIKSSRPMGLRNIQYGIAGVTPSVPRAVAGNILNMRLPDRAHVKKRPIITLIYNMGANCGVPPQQLTNRAAAVAALIDSVEAAGYSCEVYASALTKTSRWETDKTFTGATMVRLKEASQPVDVIRMAFGLGHAAMFRRMVFADWGTSNECKVLGYGLGSSHDFDRVKEEMEHKSVYTVPSAEDRGDLFDTPELTLDKGVDYLVEALKCQGCPAFSHQPRMTEEELKKKFGEKKKFKWGLPEL